MRRIPQIALCLAILSACTSDPIDPIDPAEEPIEPIPEAEFAQHAAETLCAELFACQCGDSPSTMETEPLPWASETECVTEKTFEYQALLDEALTFGSYSPECGGRMIADFERTDCRSSWDYLAAGGHYYDDRLCPLVTRGLEVGADCEPFPPIGSDCGQGLACDSMTATCVEIGELPVGLGGDCEIGFVDLPCADGLFCTRHEEGYNTCELPAEVGSPCNQYQCLGADVTCDGSTVTCVAKAAEGESCESTSCAAGLYCDGGQGSTCVAQYGYGSGCANDSVCADGGSCIDNICTPPQPVVCSWLY